MTAETTTTAPVTGGFAGDPAEAFSPPGAAGGCCGSPTTDAAVPREDTCCGTAAEAHASGGCCGEAAKEQAIASGTGCCG